MHFMDSMQFASISCVLYDRELNSLLPEHDPNLQAKHNLEAQDDVRKMEHIFSSLPCPYLFHRSLHAVSRKVSKSLGNSDSQISW